MSALLHAFQNACGEDLARSGPCVYVVVSGDAVKIGFTRSLGSRMRTLQSGSPAPLALACVFWGAERSWETALHARFSRHRTWGEWFRDAGISEMLKRQCYPKKKESSDWRRRSYRPSLEERITAEAARRGLTYDEYMDDAVRPRGPDVRRPGGA